MRRLLLALFICLLPLQSFAGLVMNAKMTGMELAMKSAMESPNAAQAPCHEASQPMAAESQDCCGLQGACQALCHFGVFFASMASHSFAPSQASLPQLGTTHFSSASLASLQKPPLV